MPALRQGVHDEAGIGLAHAGSAQESTPHLPSLPTRLPTKVQPEETR